MLLKKGTTQAAGKVLSCVVAADDELLRKKGNEHEEAIKTRASKRGNQAAATAASAAGADKEKGDGRNPLQPSGSCNGSKWRDQERCQASGVAAREGEVRFAVRSAAVV